MSFRFLISKKVILAAIIAVIFVAGFSGWRFFLKKEPGFNIFKKSDFERQFNINFKDYSGNDVNLLAFKNHPLILYSWASWCPFCKKDLISLSKLQKENNQLVVVAINRAEPAAIAKAYSGKLGIDNLVLLLDSNDSFYKLIGGFAMPEAIFIDKNGSILEHRRGPLGKIPAFH